MTLKSLPALLFALALLLPAQLLTAAEPALERFSFEERHMGTLFRIIVYAPERDKARQAARAAFARIHELDAIMSDYQPTSELMRLCARAGGDPVPVSKDLFFVLSRAQEVSRRSDGAFDVTVGPVVRLWRLARRTQKLPDPEKLARARALVGYKNVRLDAKASTVQLLLPGMQLDLGGIAKGYAADEALAVLKKHGLSRALVAAGGDITVSDPPPGPPGWRVAIQPLPGEKVAGVLMLHHAAVSTSGDAEQFVVIDGKRYSHIVDPRTGIGLVGRMSATVVAPRGITADSHTKVLAVLGPERGLKLIEAVEGVSGRMVYETESGLRGVTSKRFPPLVPADTKEPAPQGARPARSPAAMSPRKKVAAVVTEYRHWSHADIIVGKLLEGYHNDGGGGPGLELVSLYTDQQPPGDLSRPLAKKHGFTIYPTIEDALTRGGRTLAVDGVLCIGEHGSYPTNDKEQVLYPRRWFFDHVTRVFARSGRVVPVFNDKHLSATWTDAKWMYDRAKELSVPLLAGSSLPVTWRRPELQLPRSCEITEVVQVGYGPLEGYGFHALEAMQCMVERRKGGETGVRAVQCLSGEAMWQALDRGEWSQPVFEAALALVPAHAPGDYRKATAAAPDAAVFLIEYRDGLRAAVPMPNGWIYEGDGGAFTFAARLRGKERPVATLFYLQQPEPFAHFAFLVRAIDALIQTGKPPYPVERTLLTTGILDALMTSRSAGGRRIETPHLAIRYQPTDWPFATGPIPQAVKH